MMIPEVRAPWTIAAQGDRTLLLLHDGPISVATGKDCAHAANALRNAGFRGVVDIVPTFNSVALHYQPRLFGTSTTFKRLATDVARVIDAMGATPADTMGRTVDIPVCYGGDFGPDLVTVADHCGLTPDDIVRLHSAEPAYVFMLGFAPGAAYIGMHDAALDIERRKTPRTALPRGAVAIANRQTIIYPNPSPGGWHIIGNTPIQLFFPDQDPPTLLAPGDSVRFVPISADEHRARQETP